MVGDDATIVVDTGLGLGDLAGLARSFAKPVLGVVNTHDRPDHVLGNCQFDAVWAHEADSHKAIRHGVPIARREGAFAHITAQGKPDGLTLETWNHRPPGRVEAVANEHVFDLGGRTLTAIHAPGHTPGSICLFDSASRYLIVGDTLNPGEVWLQLAESLPLGSYLASLRRTAVFATSHCCQGLLSGHGPQPLPVSLISEMIDCVERILSGAEAGQPSETRFGPCLKALLPSGATLMYDGGKLEAR